MQQPRKIASHPRRGSALVFAIGLLAVFFALGIAYVNSGTIVLSGADYDVRALRAREIAAAGIHAAIGDLRKGVLNGRVNDALGNATYTLPAYGAINEGDGATLSQLSNRKSEAQVTLSDESGKVNLNHAPASVLQAVLGVDGAAARAIRGSLPGPANAEGQWLALPEDLVTRKLLSAEKFGQINRELVTTFTVGDHTHPEQHLNVNKAAAEVWAALFNVPLDTAQKAYVKRPFTSLEGLLEALGKLPPPADPTAAPAPPVEPPVPAALTSMLGFESRTFRLVSEGLYANTTAGRDHLRARARVEAVVSFDEQGNYTLVYWSEAKPDTAAAPQAPVPSPEPATASPA